MSRRIFNRLSIVVAVLLSANVVSSAQAYGSYTPYSIFGVGELKGGASAYNKSMGGVGIASRNHRFLNHLNPAAVTARDSLAFMADYSLYQDNSYSRQGNMNSASNTFNIGDLMLSFPIYRSSAIIVGIAPYSDTGFGYSYNYDDPDVIGNVGNVTYTASGSGSIYQAFAGAGVSFWDRLSLGAEAILHFGRIEKKYYETFSQSSYNGASNGYDIKVNGWAGKFGLQYEQPLGKKSAITIGATYKTSTNLGGNVEGYRYSSGTAASDTLYYSSKAPENVRLASEKGIGLCYRYADNFMAEFDYTRADWNTSGFDTAEGFMGNTTAGAGISSFKTSIQECYRFGVEWVPNWNDIRYYYKKIAYRFGTYYKNEAFAVDGKQISSAGISLGATLPVFRWYNGITVAVDLGQRGTIADNLVRERYVNFSIGFNLFDIWFQKPMYE